MKKLNLAFVAFALVACSGRDAKQQDSALARDLALANQAQSPQPQFQDTAASSGGTRRAPAQINNPPRTRPVSRPTPSQPAAAAAPSREIASGASFALAAQQRICTNTNRPGDRFVATVTSPVVGSNGAVVPAGASVVLEVAAISGGDNASMALRVVSVDFDGVSYRVNGDAATQSAFERTKITTDPNGDKKKVIGGAIAGAIIGQMIGHNTKGTVIGAATGAAGGAIAAKAMEKYDSCLPVGGAITLRLNSALVL